MDIQELREIIRLLKDEGLTEITVSDGDQRVTVKQILHESFRPPLSLASSAAPSAQPAPSGLPEREFHLTAPLVGTFHGRPSPEDDAFVSEGDLVQPGDTVCIIEAMKVMNEIKAEERGRLRHALLEDGAAVEFGQPLFVFERP